MFLQRLTNPDGATALTIGTTASAAINGVAEADAYTLAARANDVFLMRVGFVTGDATPVVTVLDPDGVKICAAGDLYARGTEATRCVAPRAGSYTVIVGDYRALRTGNYSLYVQRLTGTAGSVALTAGDTASATVLTEAEADTFTWIGSASDRLQLRMAVTGGELRPSLRVFDPDGIKVCEASSPYSVSIEISSCLLPRSGPYTILAADTAATRAGSYRLSLTCLATPCGGGQTVSIDGAGGEVTLGELRIRIPAGAFTEPISLTLAPLSTTNGTSVGTASILRGFLVQARTRGGAVVQTAQLPLTYEIAVNVGEISARGIDPTQLRIALWDSGSAAWAEQATTWDATRGVVSTTSASLQNVVLTAEVSAAARNVAYLPLVRR